MILDIRISWKNCNPRSRGWSDVDAGGGHKPRDEKLEKTSEALGSHDSCHLDVGSLGSIWTCDLHN